MEGQAEAYNQTWISPEEERMIKLFLSKNPNVAKHFKQKIKLSNVEEDLEIQVNEHSNECESIKQGQKMSTGMAEMNRKCLSNVNLYFIC